LKVVVPLCAVAAVALVPAATASAATTSSSCTRQVLLLPGMSTSCGTGVVTCTPHSNPVNTCAFSARAVAAATVGIAVGGKASSNATEVKTPLVGSPQTISTTQSASCTNGLAILGGCTGATNPTSQVGFAGFDATTAATYQSGAQGVCVWTGGPIAVLVTLTCTETINSTF
jgi:hypothetical protein